MLSQMESLDPYGRGVHVGPAQQSDCRMRIELDLDDDTAKFTVGVELDRGEVEKLAELCAEALKQ